MVRELVTSGRKGEARGRGTYHFSFFFSVEEVIVVLHGDELMPTMFLRDILFQTRISNR